ncbi:uncharacterized protein LOC133493798 isoform X2 [Syngnathoides biaculeatus]|uniref:uncharacterized protein LOC133493798 isoform X2 n=1 Tax=Syngnathoides biaculeatus TaxID=300417 RepID=UPI002ADDBA5F|nr:uncharacterized protein LOC133493798 isoform X2 [Syngnathoides biaculeatus]
MPTCCAPNCNKTEKSHPNLSFFNLPWGKPERITLWLSQLRLVHQPGKCARICSDHFEERFLEQDLKFSIAPHLYTKQKKTLTVDAYPTIFEHKKQSAVREISINRQKKRRRKLLIDESLNQTEKSEGACAFSTCPSDKETTDESPFTSQYSGENTSAPNVKCQCRCMCRQCTRPKTCPVATQTERVVTFVKVSQCCVPTYHKSVQRRKCDLRVKMCARTTGEYKEEVRGPKKEEEPQRQRLDDVFNLQPRIVLHRAVEAESLLQPA